MCRITEFFERVPVPDESLEDKDWIKVEEACLKDFTSLDDSK